MDIDCLILSFLFLILLSSLPSIKSEGNKEVEWENLALMLKYLDDELLEELPDFDNQGKKD